MDQKKKRLLVVKLEKHLFRIEEDVKRARESLQFYSEQAMSSWSIAGERKCAETDLKLAMNLLEKSKELYQEITTCPLIKIDKISPPCFVTIEFNNDRGKKSSFYFLKTNLRIPGIKIISPSSSLGQAILNKEVTARFSYQATDGQVISGIIKDIQ